MYMRGQESNLFPVVVLIGLIFSVTVGLVYLTFHESSLTTVKGWFTRTSNETQAPTPETSALVHRTCSFKTGYWALNNTRISSVQAGTQVNLVLEGSDCEGMSVRAVIYERYGSSKHALNTVTFGFANTTAQLPWNTDASASPSVEYYFVAFLVSNESVMLQSDNLEIGTVPLVRTTNSLLCQGFSDDRSYLYNVSTTVSTKADGTQTFTVMLNGTLIRTNTREDRFFYDHSNEALSIHYTIVPVCGGVDIVYTVTNPSNEAYQLPDFTFGGIQQHKSHARYLEPRQWGTLKDVTTTALYDSPWPDVFAYSPVMVTVNDEFAQGTSIQYPFRDYGVNVLPYMEWSDQDVLERYVFAYDSFYHGSQKGSIRAHDEQTYTVSLRFAPARYWLLTLEPYKRYFTAEYGSLQSSSAKDMHPVAAVTEAYREYYNATNPRGYVDWYTPGTRLDHDGWGAEVTRLLNVLGTQHYQRLMLWHTAGVYDPNACAQCNDFPAQFMDWLPKLVETQGELHRLAQAGISLGFWWGRSGQVPVPVAWPPDHFVSANYSNATQHAYQTNQLALARQRGVRVLGLDSFTYMYPVDRSLWLDEMRQIDSSLHFVHESGGADIFHTRAANFYTDPYVAGKGWTTIAGPHVLSWYLNPKSEVWVLAAISNADRENIGTSGMYSRAKQLVRWGYTFIDNGPYLDASNLDVGVSECLDHTDNDHDGLADWPYDTDCSDEFDESE